MHACMYACMHACMDVCMHACMDVCMHACIYIYLVVLYQNKVPQYRGSKNLTTE